MSPVAHGRPRGFTLLEVLVAVTITGLLLAGAYAGVKAVLDAGERHRQAREADRRERHARSLLAALLRSAGPVGRRDTAGLVGLPGPETPSGGDEILLRSALGFAFAGFPDREPLRARLWVAPGGSGAGTLLLELRAARLRGPADTIPLLEGVTRMEASYRNDAGRWVAAWDGRADLPRAVRLVFEGTDPPLPVLLIGLPGGRGL